MARLMRKILVILFIIATYVKAGIFDEKSRYDFGDSGDVEILNILSYERKITKQDRDEYLAESKNPPPHEQGAKMARYIVHNSDWASLGSVSSLPDTKGYPFTDVTSISDGPLLNSSGIPYLYMTPLDISASNIARDNRCSLSLTLAEGDYCKENNFDPEDPRCAHVVLTGRIVKVSGTPEEESAKTAVFTRHPVMKNWPKDHNWFFAKMKIEQICLLDYFGGPKFINIDDYFNVNI